MKHKNHGMTLIETILYIGLFGMLMSGAVVATWQVMATGAKNERAVGIQIEGAFLTQKIKWALTGASSVMVTGSSTLVVTRPDLASVTPSQSPLTFSASGTTITLARGAFESLPLTNEALHVSDVSFTVTPATGNVATATAVSFSIEGKPFSFITYLR